MVGIATGIALVTALKISGLGFVNQTPEVPGQVPGQLPGHMGGGMGLGMIGTGGGAGSMSALPNWRQGLLVPYEWSKANAEVPVWLDGAADTEANELEAVIRRALNERIDVSFRNTPLSSFVQTLSDQLGIAILIDAKGLEDETITPEDPVTVDRKDTRARDIIRQVLEPLNLTTVVKGEALLVTAKKNSSNINRYYDLSFIFPNNTVTNDLIQAIEMSITPDTWLNAGGTSTMSMVGSVLVVRANEETQEELANLLRGIAKQDPTNLKPLRFVE
jgi:type II secretory pathway component GspD/PulD (secretin)